mmetsp:Transcript_25130/g.60469  ORF Transcript_25130/g.60469 Transcript_25130/m.60469 type:complete len:89 (+) Transcript_25130:129-395(+)
MGDVLARLPGWIATVLSRNDILLSRADIKSLADFSPSFYYHQASIVALKFMMQKQPIIRYVVRPIRTKIDLLLVEKCDSSATARYASR